MKKAFGNAILVLILLCILPFSLPRFIGWNVYEVKSTSMEPVLPKGSIVFVDGKDGSEIKAGDIISYYVGNDENNVVSHRVYEIRNNNQILTKGDNNENVDSEIINYSHVIGEVRFCIKEATVLKWILKTNYGKCIIVVVFLVGIYLTILEDKKKLSEKSNKRLHVKCAKILGTFAGIALIMYSLFNIMDYIYDLKQSDKRYKELNNIIVESSTETVSNWYDMAKIDITTAQQRNSDVVAWIYFENEKISYPIMYSVDNTKYLHRGIDNETSRAGSIFVEAGNNPDFQDYHTIIYGHNMKDLSMFGRLKYYYQDKEYYKNHKYFQIITNNRKYRYEIFGYEKVLNTDKVYSLFEKSDEEYAGYLDYLNQISYNDTGVVVKNTDKIVSLSTCTNGNERFVVHGVRVDSVDY